MLIDALCALRMIVFDMQDNTVNILMTSSTLRRRLHHGDVDGKRHEHLETSELDGLNEPLLGNYDYDDRHSEVIPHFILFI
jgi:hypothetical protein